MPENFAHDHWYKAEVLLLLTKYCTTQNTDRQTRV